MATLGNGKRNTGVLALVLAVVVCCCPVGWGKGRPVWGLGTVVGAGSGISFMYRPEFKFGYHMVGRIPDQDTVAFELDGQMYFVPPGWYGTNLNLYTGIGLMGQATKRPAFKEEYFGVMPCGAEWRNKLLPIAVFADVAAVVGPLVTTALVPRWQLGIRAIF